jgi:two-component system nitrogen regulation response regulator GlnG
MPLSKQRVLCVDDDEDTCFVLRRLLEQEGYEAETARTVAEALEMSRERPFDLYVLDVRFSAGNGASLCRRIREAAPHTPLVVYSSASRMDDRQEALLAGANAFVNKPEIEKLAEVVRALLNFSTNAGRK